MWALRDSFGLFKIYFAFNLSAFLQVQAKKRWAKMRISIAKLALVFCKKFSIRFFLLKNYLSVKELARIKKD